MKNYKIVNWIKRNIYGVVIEVGKVDRVGFFGGEDYYIDRVKYRFGKPITARRYWDEKEFKENKNFVKKGRTVIKGFKLEKASK